MDVAAGAGGHGPQKIPDHNGVRVCPADAPGGLRGNAAGAVRAETAADALKAKGTLGTLSLYPVVGSLHGQRGDELLQGLIRAFAGSAAVALVHVV